MAKASFHIFMPPNANKVNFTFLLYFLLLSAILLAESNEIWLQFLAFGDDRTAVHISSAKFPVAHG